MQNVVRKNPRTTKPHLLLAHTRLPWTCLRVCLTICRRWARGQKARGKYASPTIPKTHSYTTHNEEFYFVGFKNVMSNCK
jgi:hypothetical protein